MKIIDFSKALSVLELLDFLISIGSFRVASLLHHSKNVHLEQLG